MNLSANTHTLRAFGAGQGRGWGVTGSGRLRRLSGDIRERYCAVQCTRAGGRKHEARVTGRIGDTQNNITDQKKRIHIIYAIFAC